MHTYGILFVKWWRGGWAYQLFLPHNFYTQQKGIVIMFEFKFTEEQNMLREMTREFTDNEIKPIAAKIDKDEKIPDELIKKLGALSMF